MSHDDRPGDSSGPMTWPRYTETPTFMRTPFAEALDDVDAGLTGAPFDGGVTNRHGPHGIRNRSSLMRHFNRATKVAPHDLCRVCDVWDTPIGSPFHLESSLDEIEQAFARLHNATELPRPWLYCLHYHEFLHRLPFQPARDVALDWIAHHRPGPGRTGWEPCPVSRRITD